MRKIAALPKYSPAEEKINVASHALGFILSALGLLALLQHAITRGDALHIISFATFGISLVILYGTSTIYHSTKNPQKRTKLRVLDHASIYVLIAGTYTPFSLIVLQGTVGYVIFGVSWAMAITGITLKLFFTGKYTLVSTLLYVFMGWLIVFAVGPLMDNFPQAGLLYLVVGGLSYTLGAVLYSIKRLRFNHAIFHCFVLLGSSCHFIAVYFYVL